MGKVTKIMNNLCTLRQKRFSKIYIMGYEKESFGKIKLTAGELRGSNQKVQYCITAIENDY